MSCFPCFGRREKKGQSSSDGGTNDGGSLTKRAADNSKDINAESTTPQGSGNIQAQCFKFRELAAATDHFTPDFLLGEGDFARVYKGSLDNGNQTVAIKQLDRNGLQDSKEFLVQVLMLSLLHHPNLVNLIGYCADGDQRLLVYEYMPHGTLEDHLLDLTPDKQPMSWYTRMKIAYGAAQGLEYLHDKANPPVIYRDFKSSKILLDENLTPKLSDICLSKIGNMGDRVTGTYGYCAPEGDMTGQLTLKSDVYSFGVVLLELITGRRAVDTTKPTSEQNLVAWAKPMFREQKRYPELVDPLIKDNFPSKGLNQVVAIAAMCLQEESSVRPLMADVVITLGFLVDAPPEPSPPPPAPDPTPQVDLPKSSDSSAHVVETLQLGVRGQGSKPPSRTTSRSSSSSESESDESDGSVSSKHSKRSSQCGSGSSKHRKRSSRCRSVSSKHRSLRCKSDATSSLKYSRKESEHRKYSRKESDNRSDASDGSDDESDESSSSKHSMGSSKHGSGVYLSLKHSRDSSKIGSRSSSSKHYQESQHESGGEESDGSVSRHSEESEHEYESD